MEFSTALMLGLVAVGVIYTAGRPAIARATRQMINEKAAINRLFTILLTYAAALLSFAHGANDVANAVGPLAAINDALVHGGIAQKAAILYFTIRGMMLP